MIYTDNGSRETPLEEIDLLTLAADQVGLAIENEFLRSRLAADRPRERRRSDRRCRLLHSE